LNPQDPLANLHPLREPAAIGWWPPAPGWWALLLIAVIVAGLTAYLLWRRHRRNAYRRRALAQLDMLRLQFRENGDPLQYIEQVNALLKGVALLAYPRTRVASQHGESWREFLNTHLPPAERFDPAFDTACYAPEPPDIDTERLHHSARSWIRHHKVAA
jgi:hypothetical protein